MSPLLTVGLSLVWLVNRLPVLTFGLPTLEPESISSGGPVVLSLGGIVNLPTLKVTDLLLVWAVGLSTLGEVILLPGLAVTLFPAGLPLVCVVGLSPVWAEKMPQALGFQLWHSKALTCYAHKNTPSPESP